MAKKKTAKKKAAKPARRRTAALATNEVVLTKIIIPKTGNTPKPVKLVSFHRGPVVWLVHNKNANAQTISIDPASFVDHNNNDTPLNPLSSNNPLTTTSIAQGKWDVLIAMVDKAAVITSYGYVITQMDMVTGLRVRPIDPDLDVVDPQP